MNSAILANFQESLRILLYGMGGIFFVLILIFIMIKGLIKLFPEK